MTIELFRREVIENRRQRLYGEVALATPLSTWAITALLAAIVASGVAVLLLGSYARKETVSGWVTTDKGLARLAATDFAVVSAVHVREGDAVSKGAPLMTLTQDAGLGSGSDLVGVLSQELEKEENALKARKELAHKQAESERTDLLARRQKMAAEIAELRKQQAVQAKLLKIARETQSQYEALVAENAASVLEANAQKETVLSETQGLNELAGRILSSERSLQEIDAALAASPDKEQAALAELDGALAALAGRRANLARQGAEVIRAPVAGRLAALPAHAGESVAPQMLLAAILPKGGALEAELFVPTRAVGFIRTGQEVRLQYDAFSFQKFGWGEGRVIEVSKTIYAPADLPPAVAPDEPSFRVAVALVRPYVEAYGERYSIQAGMTLKADVIQDKRKLWRVLFDPVLAATRG